MSNRFERQSLIIGENATHLLSTKKVALFGVGGVGSYAAEALARCGVGTVELIDSDTVSQSNINRQLCALNSTVGLVKVDVVAKRLKDMGARNIYVCCAFGLFCNGLDAFDEAYEKGWISKVFTTNLIYRSPELLERKWFCEVDLSKYISLIIDALNHDMSISSLLNHAQRIKPFLEQKGYDIKITD